MDGIDWKDGAVCNCRWSGPLLADVLAHCGLTLPRDADAHVTFNCHQTDVQDDEFYGSSIPLSRCLDPSKKVLLALDMNGKPLDVNHGSPLRLVAPIACALSNVSVAGVECRLESAPAGRRSPHAGEKSCAASRWKVRSGP